MSSSPPAPIDLATASAVVTGAYSKFGQCAMKFEWIASYVRFTIGEEEALQKGVMATVISWHPVVFTLLLLLLGVIILLVGFMLIRPINFAVGFYLGGSLCLLLLTLFAPATTLCHYIVGLPILIAVLTGVLCAWKRGSMFALIGLVSGEIVGRLIYDMMLVPLNAPEYLAYSCIGFFAVVCSCVMFYIGDYTWIFGCAFGGAYLIVASFLQLALVPFFPESHLDRFVGFEWPDVTRLHDVFYHKYYTAYILGDSAIYTPLLVVCVLAIVGTRVQIKCLNKSKKVAKGEVDADKEDMEKAAKTEALVMQ